MFHLYTWLFFYPSPHYTVPGVITNLNNADREYIVYLSGATNELKCESM